MVSRIWLVMFLAVLVLSATLAYRFRVLPASTITLDLTPKPVPKIEPPKPAPPAKKSPATVPFYSQAPFKLWDALHEDACEEAAVLMVKYWVEGIEPSLATHDQNIKDFIAWQTKHGYGKSVSIPELYQAAIDFYDFSMEVATVDSAAKLKALIDAGQPVIWPADGKKLHNPHFKDGGPPYHMLVVIGYEGDTFITQDPGTQFGENYRYGAATLLAAQADWDGTRASSTDHRVLTTRK